MKIDKALLDELTGRAKLSPRLRLNYDLRNSEEDKSQRMLNAIEPGTVLPVHRHRKSSETVICLRGHLQEIIYDGAGEQVVEIIDIVSGGPCFGYNVPIGVWHSLKAIESGTVILSVKDGRYEPLGEGDVIFAD